MSKQTQKPAETAIDKWDDMPPEDVALATNTVASVGMLSEYQGMDKARLDALVAEGFSLEQVVGLPPDGEFRGILLGPGGDIITENPEPIKTWRFRPKGMKNGLVASLMGAAQLNSRLAAAQPGSEVLIRRTGQVRSRAGRPVNTYDVFIKPPEAQ